MINKLLTPILEQGIQNIHFFNGRVLTAEDMRAEQQAHRLQRQQLGQAIGTGVVRGLEVRVGTASGIQPTVFVTSGLAINRRGVVVCLPDELEEVEVTLVREEPTVSTEAALFADCKPPETTAVPVGVGVYVLVVSPASGYKARAPKVGFDDNGVARGCGSRYAVEGIQFRLVKLDVGNASVVGGAAGDDLRALIGRTDAASLSKFRNLLAHLCLGTVEAAAFAQDLLGDLGREASDLTYGLLDVMRDRECLTDCDVPLALIYWTLSGIEFVDMWSVRRRVHAPLAAAHPPFLVTDRRMAEAEADFLQFQEQITYMTREGVSQLELNAVEATSYFRFLPAAGVLPLAGTGGLSGVDRTQFFSKVTVRDDPVFMEGSRLRSLLHRSFEYPPVDLASKEMVWLYFVRENVQQLYGNPSNPPQPYLVFTNGHIPYQGDAQYDLGHFDYGNYGVGVAGKTAGG